MFLCGFSFSFIHYLVVTHNVYLVQKHRQKHFRNFNKWCIFDQRFENACKKKKIIKYGDVENFFLYLFSVFFTSFFLFSFALHFFFFGSLFSKSFFLRQQKVTLAEMSEICCFAIFGQITTRNATEFWNLVTFIERSAVTDTFQTPFTAYCGQFHWVNYWFCRYFSYGIVQNKKPK